jgi:MoaA/NifB/PqqE/SkfB family radical SAM enzyme
MANGYYSIILTENCNMSCAHCCQMSGPKVKSRMTVEEALEFIDFISKKEPKFLGISGGEVFLIREDLKTVIGYAKNRGVPMIGCVSNCSWARNYKVAHEILSEVKQAGLDALAISFDDFHLPFITLDKIKNAIKACVDLGIHARLHVVVTKETNDLNYYLSQLGDLAKYLSSSEEILAMPSGRALLEIPKEDFIYTEGIPTGKCPSETFTVTPNKKIQYCCSGFGTVHSKTAPLQIGDLNESTYEEIFELSNVKPLFKVIREKGPQAFIPEIIESGLEDKLFKNYVNVCHLCTEILNDSEMRKVAETVANKLYVNS